MYPAVGDDMTDTVDREFEKVTAAEEHLRFVLNTAEGVLGVLGTSVNTASLADHAQPETKRAFAKVAKALNQAFSVVRDERAKASAAMKKRVIDKLKKAP